jgi:large subunit ribosomal protein L30
MKKLQITQVKSAIGRKPIQGKNLRALGITHVGQTVVHNDTPQIRGMVFRIDHLLSVTEVEE